MELSSPKIKIFIIFSQKKLFWYFGKWNFFKKTFYISEGNFQSSKSKKETRKKFLIFREMKFSSPKLKKLILFL